MASVGKHSGEAVEESPGLGTLLRLVLSMLATLAAWGALVWLAIHFGGLAKTGQTTAWALMVIAGVGAAACLFLGIIVATRLIVTAGVMRRVTHIARQSVEPDRR